MTKRTYGLTGATAVAVAGLAGGLTLALSHGAAAPTRTSAPVVAIPATGPGAGAPVDVPSSPPSSTPVTDATPTPTPDPSTPPPAPPPAPTPTPIVHPAPCAGCAAPTGWLPNGDAATCPPGYTPVRAYCYPQP